MRFNKTFAALLLSAGMVVSAVGAEVVVRLAPPHAVVEHRGPAPGAGYVWIPGYHNWDGSRHVWVGGRWERPPHPGARWEAHRWVHRNGGYVLMEGHWR